MSSCSPYVYGEFMFMVPDALGRWQWCHECWQRLALLIWNPLNQVQAAQVNQPELTGAMVC